MPQLLSWMPEIRKDDDDEHLYFRTRIAEYSQLETYNLFQLLSANGYLLFSIVTSMIPCKYRVVKHVSDITTRQLRWNGFCFSLSQNYL